MKKSTCKDLGGPCDFEITGETPVEMGENCRNHVSELVGSGDKVHTQAIEEWKKKSEEDQQKFWEEFEVQFESLPEA